MQTIITHLCSRQAAQKQRPLGLCERCVCLWARKRETAWLDWQSEVIRQMCGDSIYVKWRRSLIWRGVAWAHGDVVWNEEEVTWDWRRSFDRKSWSWFSRETKTHVPNLCLVPMHPSAPILTNGTKASNQVANDVFLLGKLTFKHHWIQFIWHYWNVVETLIKCFNKNVIKHRLQYHLD